jgi:hypothetical protein
MFALHANAAVINGVNYKQFTGSGNTCPDGSAVFVYKNVKYCKAFRANISWNIPASRSNGDALPISELKGYEVYWTRSTDNASGVIKVNSAPETTTMLDVYTPGTYSFAMAAIDTAGLKSALSPVVETTLGN